MNHGERQARLKSLLVGISPDDTIEAVMPASTIAPVEAVSVPSRFSVEAARLGMEKLALGQSISPDEAVSIEAIVLPRERPVVFVVNDDYDTPEHPWEHFAQAAIKANVQRALPLIGRVELPDNLTVPFGGTAFVVGPNLLMTNRHVAQLFARGLGQSSLSFISGQSAGWDPKKEYDANGFNHATTESNMLRVQEIVMIHPYWDMALLRVSGLNRPALELSADPPESYVGKDIAVVGYPARDSRNDLDLQDQIFQRIYNVKRMQPGKVKQRESIGSFNRQVMAMTHDSSTLGGNSGSVLIDVATGRAVGLHFGGLYLKANYAVPMYELARDPRIRGVGVNLNGSAPTDPEVERAWKEIGDERVTPHVDPIKTYAPEGRRTSVPVRVQVGDKACVFPVELSTCGRYESVSDRGSLATEAVAALEAAGQPVIFPDLEDREGYNPRFLRGHEIALPELTRAGERAVARLQDGSFELKYHKFSIVMHKERRMALFTASNVDWRDQMRTINGKRPGRKELTGVSGSERWVTDDRIPERHQLPDVFYSRDRQAFDKGHLVRRDDVCWGRSFKDIQKGNGDTFHTTNCTPQVSGFNRSTDGEDNWGDLENFIAAESDAERVMIFSGPVLSEDDLRFEGVDKRGEVQIQIPSAYWKIIVAEGDEGLEAFGFLLEQDLTDVPLEFAVPKKWIPKMESIAGIERRLFRLVSLAELKPFDQYQRLRRRGLR